MKAIEDQVLHAEQEWLQAHREMDIVLLERLMHADYTIIRPDGSVWDKTQALESYQTGQRSWETAEIDQLEVRVYTDTAVVIGRWRAKGVNQGETFDYSARYVSVWVKENGGWQMVCDQSTEIS